jgi:hypothetical protein
MSNLWKQHMPDAVPNYPTSKILQQRTPTVRPPVCSYDLTGQTIGCLTAIRWAGYDDADLWRLNEGAVQQ